MVILLMIKIRQKDYNLSLLYINKQRGESNNKDPLFFIDVTVFRMKLKLILSPHLVLDFMIPMLL